MIPIGSKNVFKPAPTHANSYIDIPIERTNAIINILKRGSSYPPKNPTVIISNVAKVIIAGIEYITLPMSLYKITAAITDKIISVNIDIEIQCLHTSFSLSQRVSFSGGVKILTPYLARLSTTC